MVFTQSFAAALVRPELVALNAPALEPPLGVGTALAAVAFFGTLVHIWNGPQSQNTRGGRDREVLASNSRRVNNAFKTQSKVRRGGWKVENSFTLLEHILFLVTRL